MNSIIDVVGFLDVRSNQENNDDLEEPSSTVKESYCIHTIQFKIIQNLIQNNIDMSK